MKIFYFIINLLIGLTALGLGAVVTLSVFGTPHNYYAVAFFGICLVAMAAVCFCLCGECLGRRRRNERQMA